MSNRKSQIKNSRMRSRRRSQLKNSRMRSRQQLFKRVFSNQSRVGNVASPNKKVAAASANELSRHS